MFQYDFTFSIVVDFTGTKFSGKCHHAEDTYEKNWSGISTTKAQTLHAKRNKLCSVSARLLQTEKDSLGVQEPTLQNLLNISQYITVTDSSGNPILIDTAQQETGTYFEDILVNSLPEDTIKHFFGSKRVLNPNVEQTPKKHEEFYKSKAVMNLGQLLHESFLHSGTPEDQKAAAQINIEKIQTDWKNASKTPEFGAQSTELYCDAYENKVTDLKIYLDKREYWANELYKFVISNDFLSIWRAQIASLQFRNVKDKIYEFYTKLTVLDSSPKGCAQAQNAVSVMFATVLNVASQTMNWVDDYREKFIKYLTDAILNLRIGNIKDLETELEQQNAKELQEYTESLISTYDSIDQLVEDIADLLAFTASKKEAAAKPFLETIDLALDSARTEHLFQNLAKGFGKAGWALAGKLLRVVGYTAGIGLCIYLFTSKDGAEDIIEDIGLSICASTFLIKGGMTLIESSLGKWIVEKIGGIGDNVAKFSKNLGKWFSSEGEITGTAAKIFGKNAEAFMKTRLGPVCAIASIVLSGFFLKDSIDHHDTFNTVMESLNLTFATLDLTMIGLSICSFSWAGPLGIAIGVIGGVTILIQLLYNIFSPPKHEPDEVEKFIYGPLNDAGYVM